MSSELKTLVALDGEVDRGLIETVVTHDPHIHVVDYLELDGPPSSRLGVGDALIVAVADYTPQVRDFVATARRQHPLRPIVLMCPPSGNGYLSEAFDSGVDDIVGLPTEPAVGVDLSLARQLAFTLEKAVMRKRGGGETETETKHNVICVLGLKGGSGKTLTSINLSVALAQAGHSVAIIDLDLQFGDVALAMGLNPVKTMYDLVRSGGSLDAEKLQDFLVEHDSGVKVLLAPVRPDQAAAITVPFLADIQRLLSEMFDFVVIDTPPAFSPEVISALDSSNEALVVVMRDTLSLKNSKLGLETLERMDYDPRRVKILLNRANTNVGIERDDVLAILGRDVDILLPSDRAITRSINEGIPIVTHKGTEAARAFRSLAQQYIDASLNPSEAVREAEPAVTATAPAKAKANKAKASRPPRKPLFLKPRGSK
jgi:pilus assembly protein CpaE